MSWLITLVGLQKEGLDCPKKKESISVFLLELDYIAEFILESR